jgi:hypothetical protein
MKTNPFQRVIDEGARQLGKSLGAVTRNRTAGKAVPGSGAPEVGGSVDITPSGRFTIGVSAIGGTDKIGQVGE